MSVTTATGRERMRPSPVRVFAFHGERSKEVHEEVGSVVMASRHLGGRVVAECHARTTIWLESSITGMSLIIGECIQLLGFLREE